MADPSTVKLDPLALLLHGSLPVRATALVLALASTAVWAIAVVKLLELARATAAERAFVREATASEGPRALTAAAAAHADAPGARVVLEIASRPPASPPERLRAAADRAIVTERQRTASFMSVLGTVAAAAPFLGLFGTVYGIMDAFLRIGAEKSASLPVVAPAIGEALVTTAIGLAAAIPAVVFYNAIDKRAGDLVERLEASAGEWVTLFSRGPER